MIQPLPFKDNAEGEEGFYIGIFTVGTEDDIFIWYFCHT